MKLPKSFRTEKDLEEKTKQLMDHAKEKHQEEMIHFSNSFDTIYQEIAFLYGREEGVGENGVKYCFKEGDFTVEFELYFDEEHVFKSNETTVYENDRMVLFDIEDSNQVFADNGWDTRFVKIYQKYISEEGEKR